MKRVVKLIMIMILIGGITLTNNPFYIERRGAEYYIEWSGAYIDGLLTSQTIVQHSNSLGISIDSAARYSYSYPTSIEPITVPSIDATWNDFGKYNLDDLLEYIYDNPMDDQTGLPAQLMF